MLNELFRAKVQAYCRLAARTHRDLAAFLGFSPVTLSKKLNARRTLSKADLARLIAALSEWEVFQSWEEAAELCHLAGYPLADLPLSSKVEQELAGLASSTQDRPPGGVRAGETTPQNAGHPPHHNLPGPANRFIGRRHELEAIRDHLARTRWLTLAGPAGCGKTRLALEVARGGLTGFKDGVWLVELAGLAQGRQVAGVAAAVLRVKEQPGKPLIESLVQDLGERELLLLMDNCEHLLEPVRELLEHLLETCPGLAVLATSREKLSSRREEVLRIGPMSLPPVALAVAQVPALAQVKLNELRSYDSIQLFEDRARQAQASFKLKQANAPLVMEVCRRLDGIPLALELAAARLEALSLSQIHSRLGERFRLLSGSGEGKSGLAHHQTLRTLLDWSYDLLTPPEQALLSRLAVFRGGFSLEAVQVVCTGRGQAEEEVGKGLVSLVNKNLVQSLSEQEERRYGLLETVREYGREHLDGLPEERSTLEARHAGYYTGLVERAEPELRGGTQAARWLDRLEEEFANLSAAFKWASQQGEVELALRLSGAMWRFWHHKGYSVQGQDWLQKALGLVGNETNPGPDETIANARAKAFYSLGMLLSQTGDFPAAVDCTEKGLELYRQLGNRTGISRCFNLLGNILGHQDEYEGARDYFLQSLQLKRELDDKIGIATTLQNLASILLLTGEYEQAHTLYLEVLAQQRLLAFKPGVAMTLYTLADLELKRGHYEAGVAHAEESLALNSELGSKYGKAVSLNTLGELLYRQSKLEKAFQLQEEALALNREIGHRAIQAECYWCLGRLYYSRQDFQKAEDYFRENLGLWWETNNKEGLARNLEGLAWVALARSEVVEATRLAGCAASLRKTYHIIVPPCDRQEYQANLDKLAALLGEARFEQEWAAGRALTVTQVIEKARLSPPGPQIEIKL